MKIKPITLALCCLFALKSFSQMPLPEHPRPDWERSNWVNLNGLWRFRFDPADKGLGEFWQSRNDFPLRVNVPFPWGSPLSGAADSADIAWYARDIEIPAGWKNLRPFLVIGACDYKTTVWVNGVELGSHEGGYTPFDFDLSKVAIKPGQKARLTVRVDDKRRDYALYGKQGYGNARGIWQTVYLEGRGAQHLKNVHFSPDIDKKQVQVTAYLAEPARKKTPLTLHIQTEQGVLRVAQTIAKGQKEHRFTVSLPQMHLWSLKDPYLYETGVELGAGPGADRVKTYFGMRKISVAPLPGSTHPYIALNNEPVYLQLTLDQSYHPQGYYTFPSDAFMKDEIQRCKDIGLNGIRTHIKIDVPRKLYWADKLGLLVMSDLPNAWGEPNEQQRKESEINLRRLIERDYNHPAIFSWIVFNETWGLITKQMENGKEEHRYLPETQRWVAEMYRLAKSLDPTRLVEDNSICCGRGHTETDINSWHEYLPGYGWEKRLKSIDENTYPGSTHHFEAGYKQSAQPNINSEFGNVWGYEGSTGDVDWSWDYHRAMNAFRRYPKVSGWLYTEHHDVINEWNGYWRYDRSPKHDGMSELVPGMSLLDMHAPVYLSTGQDISRSVRPGEKLSIPLYLSSMSGAADLGRELTIKATLHGWDAAGRPRQWGEWSRKVPYKPWMNAPLDSMQIVAPAEKALAVLAIRLENAEGAVVHRNCVILSVEAPVPTLYSLPDGKKARLVPVSPTAFSAAQWSQKQWNVLDSMKANGAGSGYFEYRIPLPKDLRPEDVASAAFIAEVSAKPLLGKDKDNKTQMNDNYMLGGGAHDPSRNPNAYPMTDNYFNRSAVSVMANGAKIGFFELPDDPADHRGALSWHYQPQDGKLREAGTYGYRIEAPLREQALQAAFAAGELRVRLEVSEQLPGGLAVYGDRFGRYPMGPMLMLVLK